VTGRESRGRLSENQRRFRRIAQSTRARPRASEVPRRVSPRDVGRRRSRPRPRAAAVARVRVGRDGGVAAGGVGTKRRFEISPSRVPRAPTDERQRRGRGRRREERKRAAASTRRVNGRAARAHRGEARGSAATTR
jgi:hypothetical protein